MDYKSNIETSFNSSCNSLCRVCLEDGANLSLFEDEEDIKLYLKIMACAAIQIKEKDGYPDNICHSCYLMLDTAYKFKQKCEDSDIRLRTCVTKQIVKIEVEDLKDDFAYNDFQTDNTETFDNFYNMDVKNESCDDMPLDSLVEVRRAKTQKTNWRILRSDKSIKIKLEKKKFVNVSSKKQGTSKPKTCKAESSFIATSLLEGKCVWNGFDWKFSSQAKETSNDAAIKREAQKVKKIIEQQRIDRLNELRLKRKRKKNKPSPELCHECGKVFPSKEHLRRHYLVTHLGKVFKCPDEKCATKIFKTQEYLSRHLKRCHGEKKKYMCNDCGKQYSFLMSLKNHMKSHKGIFNWKQCPQCPQKYKTQKSVDIHVKSTHTGERPHRCTFCDSAFFHADYLKEHMRLHTGETPFKCPICKRGYAQRCNMKSHMKQHRISELNEELKASMKPNYLKLLKNC